MNKTMAACIITFLIALLLWIAFPVFGSDFDGAMFTLIAAVAMSAVSLVLLILSVLSMNRSQPDAPATEQPDDATAQPDASNAPTDTSPAPNRTGQTAQRCKTFAIAQSITIAVCTGLALLNHATDTGFMAGLLGDIILKIVLWVMVPILVIGLIVWAAQAYRAKPYSQTDKKREESL